MPFLLFCMSVAPSSFNWVPGKEEYSSDAALPATPPSLFFANSATASSAMTPYKGSELLEEDVGAGAADCSDCWDTLLAYCWLSSDAEELEMLWRRA